MQIKIAIFQLINFSLQHVDIEDVQDRVLWKLKPKNLSQDIEELKHGKIKMTRATYFQRGFVCDFKTCP